MPIDSEIYQKGIKGELSYDEIKTLPRKYEMYKAFFKHALEIKSKKK